MTPSCLVLSCINLALSLSPWEAAPKCFYLSLSGGFAGIVTTLKWHPAKQPHTTTHDSWHARWHVLLDCVCYHKWGVLLPQSPPIYVPLFSSWSYLSNAPGLIFFWSVCGELWFSRWFSGFFPPNSGIVWLGVIPCWLCKFHTGDFRSSMWRS